MISNVMVGIGLALLGFISLLFAAIALLVWKMFNSFQNPNDQINDDDIEEFEMDAYNRGLNQGVSLIHVSLYKIWSENNESVIVGSFPDIREQIKENINAMLSNPDELKKWDEKVVAFNKTQMKDDTDDTDIE